MYSEEETELRDLIMQNLENCGFLSKIKAEIRAGVFLALEEDGNFKNKVPLFNKKFDDFVSTCEGKIIISLIREFLDYYSLHFTLSIFEPEVASPTPFISRSELFDQLNIKSTENDAPILVTLLKDAVRAKNTVSSHLSPVEYSSSLKTVKMSDTTLDNVNLDQLNHENINHMKDNQNNLKIDLSVKDSNDDFKDPFNTSNKLLTDNANKIISDMLKETSDSTVKSDTFKKPSDLLSVEHDPFFDEPLPSEKTSFFKLSESSKDKPEKMTSINSSKDFDDSKKSSLSSLKDLPSLTASHEFNFFSRDSKNTLPSLDSLKSVSSSETSNEEIINLDPKENLDKKDTNVVESNEDSSEKQISEESIEEDIEEEDFSAVYDDLLNSSLSLGDDVTTDQTVSQVSVVEGVDHVEPCK